MSASRKSNAPESSSRVKAAAPEAEAMVSFKLQDVKDWKEWLDAHQSQLLRIFVAVEELAEDANNGARQFNERYSPSNVHERYDDVEDERNEALKLLRWISQTERNIAKTFDEAIHAHWLATREGGAK
jgi:hypothetical protein